MLDTVVASIAIIMTEIGFCDIGDINWVIKWNYPVIIIWKIYSIFDKQIVCVCVCVDCCFKYVICSMMPSCNPT